MVSQGLLVNVPCGNGSWSQNSEQFSFTVFRICNVNSEVRHICKK